MRMNNNPFHRNGEKKMNINTYQYGTYVTFKYLTERNNQRKHEKKKEPANNKITKIKK